jgi:hypothetical protein
METTHIYIYIYIYILGTNENIIKHSSWENYFTAMHRQIYIYEALWI